MSQIAPVANFPDSHVPPEILSLATLRRDGLAEEKPVYELLYVLAILLAVYGALAGFSLHESDTFFACTGPACLGIACMVTVIRLLLHSPMDIWTPLP